MLKNRSITLGLLSALCLSAFAAGVAPAADHRDSPNLAFSPKNANPNLRSLDINDVYLFRSPSTPSNTVMMMTVNPLIDAGVTPEQVFFSSTGAYEFKVSNGAGTDVNPEITFRCQFTAPRAGRQEIRVTRINHLTNRSELIARGQTGSNIAIRGGGQVQANVFDDPFFFDLSAFRADDPDGAGPMLPRNFNDGRQVDFFAGFNTQIIVLEVPSSTLIGGNSNVITLWARTLNVDGVQIDRMAIPTVNTVLVRPNRFIGPAPTPAPVPPLKDQFNATLPINDRTVWGTEVRNALIAFGNSNSPPNNAPFTLDQLVNILLPDVLTLDVTSSAGFVTGPLNGRQLADDVIDLELAVIVKPSGALTTDGINANNKPFRSRFPYAAAAN